MAAIVTRRAAIGGIADVHRGTRRARFLLHIPPAARQVSGEGCLVIDLKSVVLPGVILAVMSVPTIGAHDDGPSRPFVAPPAGRRVPFQVTLETTSRRIYAGDALYDAACNGAVMLDVVGVGTSAEFGLLQDHQAHCLGEPDYGDPVTIPAVQGSFRLTDGRGRTITGQYRGRLVQTFNAWLGELGPTGQWLIEGEACVSGGTRFASIVDDCAAGRYAPVRGFQNMTAQQATIFLDQTLGVMRER
jgi:hypothetical protein